MADAYIYRLATEEEWKISQDTGVIYKTALDQKDGFIHLSTAGQLVLTANAHFRAHNRLWVMLFSEEDLKDRLKWEFVPSRWDKLPHYYGDLYLHQVVKYFDMTKNQGGSFGIPTRGAL